MRAQAFLRLGLPFRLIPQHIGFRLFIEVSDLERFDWLKRLVYSQMVFRVDPGSPNHRDHLRSEWDLARTYARTYGV